LLVSGFLDTLGAIRGTLPLYDSDGRWSIDSLAASSRMAANVGPLDEFKQLCAGGGLTDECSAADLATFNAEADPRSTGERRRYMTEELSDLILNFKREAVLETVERRLEPAKIHSGYWTTAAAA